MTAHTAAVWSAELVLKLLESRTAEEATHHTPDLVIPQIRKSFAAAGQRLMFFDYDGTLTPIVKTPSAATPSPILLKSLEKLAADPRNIIYIVSGRDAEFLHQHLGHITNMGFSAEHGCFLKEPGSDNWINLTEGIDMGWRADVEEIFRCA